jgi:hypothetical protein
LISFGIKYWFVYLTVVIAAAVFITLLLYFRNKYNKELSNRQQLILKVLRFLSVGLTAFMLLSPFIKNLKKIVQNPIVIAAWDNTASVISTGDSVTRTAVIKDLKNIIAGELNNNFSLISYTFGQETQNKEDLDFSEKQSDYSNLVTTLTNNHVNENIGALILAGDGIYNQGKNPLNMLDNITFPIFTIGLGDTAEVTDARIQNVRVNRTSFSGNRFPVEIDTRFLKLPGRPLKLTVFEGEKELAQTVISPPNDDYFYTHQFILEAGEPGLKHFTATIEVAANERNTLNNRAAFVVNVLENKQKILFISDGPHPDIGAIKNTLEQQKSYEVSVLTEEPYPANLEDFNLIVLNQLPTSGKSMAHVVAPGSIQRIPILFLVGTKTFLPQLNSLMAGVQINPLAGSGAEAQATVNPSYATFTLSESFREITPKFPPLVVPFANYRLDPVFNVLLYQKVKNLETGKPLIATGVLNGRKTGFIFGEGIWRWRLNNYYLNQSHNQFNELVNQLIQYLSLKENEDNFMIDFEPVYAEIENVVMQAEVYNDAFEKINTEEVTISIENEQGNELQFTFDVKEDGYYLNAGNLPVGNYSFIAEVTIGSETYTESGNFAVSAVNLENIVTQANHRVLYQLATQTGGMFYTPDQMDILMEDLKNSNSLKPASYFQEMVNELLNLRWLFFVILFLLSMEWFLRKFWGIY